MNIKDKKPPGALCILNKERALSVGKYILFSLRNYATLRNAKLYLRQDVSCMIHNTSHKS